MARRAAGSTGVPGHTAPGSHTQIRVQGSTHQNPTRIPESSETPAYTASWEVLEGQWEQQGGDASPQGRATSAAAQPPAQSQGPTA